MDKPIHIAQVMGKMNGGGVEAVVTNYYKHIDRDRVQFDFIVDKDSKQIPRDEIEELGGRVFEIPPYSHPLAYQRELKKLFRDEKWNIVHSHINALSVFPLRAAKKAGVSIRIAHSHNTAGKGEHVRNLIKNILRCFSNVYPTHRFACSEHAGKWLFKNKSFDVIYNAIELDKFAFDANNRKQMRDELGIGDDTLVIGHAGRFMAQKNHSFLLRSFALLCEKRRDCVLLCAGEGELLDETKQLAKELGVADKVFFLGQMNDLYRLYQASDVFVLPSLYEGLGIVVIEAEQSGLPCILSDTVPAEADLTNTAVFLPIDNPATWADAMNNAECGARLETADKDFACYDIIEAAKKLAERYEKIAGEL